MGSSKIPKPSSPIEEKCENLQQNNLSPRFIAGHGQVPTVQLVQNGYDMGINESPVASEFLYDSSKSERTIFLRNVYAIFTGQSGLIALIVMAMEMIPEFHENILVTGFFKFWMYWSLAVVIGLIVLSSLYKCMRQPVVNFFIVTIATVGAGLLLGTLGARKNMTEELAINAGIVGLICLCVVIFTFQHRLHFTQYVSALLILALVFVAYIILYFSYHPYDLTATFWMILGPLTFLIVIVTITQMMVKDQEVALRPREFVFGAAVISMYIVLFLAKLLFGCFERCCPCCYQCCGGDEWCQTMA